MDKVKLTAAQEAALAWMVISGEKPSHVHLNTYIVASEQMEFDASHYGITHRFYFETPETDPSYRNAPVWKTHEALVKVGFEFMGVKIRKGGRKHHHYLRYVLEDATGTGWWVEVDDKGMASFDRVVRCRVVKEHAYYVYSVNAGKLPEVDWRA